MTRWLHHSGGPVCEPTEIPANKRHLDTLLARKMLRDYAEPVLDPAMREALEAYVATRKAEVADAFARPREDRVASPSPSAIRAASTRTWRSTL